MFIDFSKITARALNACEGEMAFQPLSRAAEKAILSAMGAELLGLLGRRVYVFPGGRDNIFLGTLASPAPGIFSIEIRPYTFIQFVPADVQTISTRFGLPGIQLELKG